MHPERRQKRRSNEIFHYPTPGLFNNFSSLKLPGRKGASNWVADVKSGSRRVRLPESFQPSPWPPWPCWKAFSELNDNTEAVAKIANQRMWVWMGSCDPCPGWQFRPGLSWGVELHFQIEACREGLCSAGGLAGSGFPHPQTEVP